MTYSQKQTHAFICAYLEACAWSSLSDDGEGYDFSDAAKKAARDVCLSFIRFNETDLDGLDPAQCGHDLWLTSAGHGAGFWDRGYGERGMRLTVSAKTFPMAAYLNNDSEIELQ